MPGSGLENPWVLQPNCSHGHAHHTKSLPPGSRQAGTGQASGETQTHCVREDGDGALGGI